LYQYYLTVLEVAPLTVAPLSFAFRKVVPFSEPRLVPADRLEADILHEQIASPAKMRITVSGNIIEKSEKYRNSGLLSNT
jgi:hypothetical protein